LTKDITIVSQPSGNPRIEFSGSTAEGTLHLQVLPTGSVVFTGSNGPLFTIDNTNTTLTIGDAGKFNTTTFVSGIAGSGFRLDDDGSNTNFEVDNITVRNTLRTHIFQKDVVKATNGYLWISDSGVISGSTGTTGAGTVTFEDSKTATFSSGQQLWYKDIDPDTGTINSVRFTLNNNGAATASGFTTFEVTADSSDLSELVSGGTAVRITGGSILLDASSTYSPFIDVFASSGSTVVRTGNIEGISSAKFGALTGYGM